MRFRTLAVLAAVSLSAGLAGANILNVGDPFQVNTYTTDAQLSAKVAADSAGNFVVAWVSDGQDGAGTAAVRKKFDSAGGVIAAEAVANTTTPGDQGLGMAGSLDNDVGSAGSGEFLVAWAAPDGMGTGVFAQRYDSSGSAAGGQFQVNTTTGGDEENPAVAVDGAGNFIVAWQSYNDIFVQRYMPNGTALGVETTVDNEPALTAVADDTPDVAADAAGNFVVVWSNVFADGVMVDAGTGILAKRFDNTGAAIGAEFQVNTYTTGLQLRPRVSMKSTGEFVVVWQSDAQDGSLEGIFGQRFDNSGVAQGTEFQSNLAEDQRQWHPDVAWDSTGGFVVVWYEYQGGGRSSGITARRYDASGVPQNAEASVQRGTFGPPYIESLGNGQLVVGYDNNALGNLAQETEVFAQKIQVANALCPPTPAVCTPSGKGKLKIKNPGDPKKRKFLWKWGGGTVGAGEFDDPVNTTDYALCIYDDSVLVGSYAVGGGGTCDGKPCWSTAGTTGFKYKAKSTNAAGVFKMILKEGAGNAKILVKMRRGNLLLPAPAGATLFNQTMELRLQLKKDPAGGSECWETVFPPMPTSNLPTDYKASQP